MGGHLRLVVMTATALAAFAVASPLTVLGAANVANHGTRPAVNAKHGSNPAERADHASSQSEGRHDGAGSDNEPAGQPPATRAGAGVEALPASPSALVEAATTAGAAPGSASHPAAPTPPPVIIEAPEAPQPNPPIAATQALTAARLDWILVGVVVLLAASVAALVRMAAFRGRRPPR